MYQLKSNLNRSTSTRCLPQTMISSFTTLIKAIYCSKLPNVDQEDREAVDEMIKKYVKEHGDELGKYYLAPWALLIVNMLIDQIYEHNMSTENELVDVINSIPMLQLSKHRSVAQYQKLRNLKDKLATQYDTLFSKSTTNLKTTFGELENISANHQDLENELNTITSPYFFIVAIIDCIQKEIKIASSRDKTSIIAELLKDPIGFIRQMLPLITSIQKLTDNELENTQVIAKQINNVIRNSLNLCGFDENLDALTQDIYENLVRNNSFIIVESENLDETNETTLSFTI